MPFRHSQQARRIADVLTERGYRCSWQQPVPRVGVIEAWVGPCVVILQDYGDGNGAELYVPADHSNRMEETLAAIPTAESVRAPMLGKPLNPVHPAAVRESLD